MKKNSVLKATALVFGLSLIAKLIGFAKSIMQASIFGTSMETDVFNVSNGFVSNILYMLTMAVAVAFVPLYIQHKTRSREDGRKFGTRTITTLFLVAIAISLFLIVFSPVVVKVIAPSYSGEAYQLTIKYFRVLCLGICFSLAAHLFTNLLNAEKVYGYSAFGSIINSIVLIALMMFFSRTLGVWSLVISVPISFVLQWLMLYYKGKRYAAISFRYGIRDESLKILLIQAIPILISQATVEINQVVDRALLTSIGVGALTAVSYSAVLYQFASTLVSTPLSTVMFTELSEAGAKKDNAAIKRILKNCYRVLLIVCIPIVAVIFFCSGDIVRIVYGHGRFTAEAVQQCAVGLQMYGLCLFPVCIKTVLSRAYYGLNDTRRPMVIGMLEVALNIGLSVALVKPLGIIGVVGATGIASVVFIIVMLIDFNKKYMKVLSSSSLNACWKILVSGVIAVVVLALANRVFLVNSLVDFIVKTLLTFAVFLVLLLALKEKTTKSILGKVLRRVRRS